EKGRSFCAPVSLLHIIVTQKLTNVHCGMASESYCHGTSRSFEMNKRNILLSAKASWIHLDEDSLTPTIVDNPPPDSQRLSLTLLFLEDSKEENIRHWLDSGFFSSTSEDLQDREKAAVSLVIPGMVQMTVQSYMRSLHQFSETPVMSRWNSFNSSQSLSSAPKSITEWLKLWEKDPVEILLDLGFGTEEPDICTKIPSRFISNASVAKGINIRVFLEAQKQRMDIENPNLYGRFRQLEVLDQVTSAFSSLLNGVNTQQQKPEESSGEEKSMMDIQRNKAKATRAKQRRLGQLLRKASRQATVCQRSPQTSGILVSFKDREEPSPTSAETDRCRTIRTCFSENNTLVGLAEEQSSTEDGALTLSQLPQAPIGKSQFLSYMPIEQPQLSSASERVVKDRPRKESNLLLTNMLRRVSALKGKPPDSFEMEEIQSFEDETPWGNPRDSTSETVKVLMTRTNSCQSDSSGFLEEPLEPFPLQLSNVCHSCSFGSSGQKQPNMNLHQVLNTQSVISFSLQNPPFPGNLNLGCDTHDRKSALPQRTALVASHRDFYQKPKSPVAYTSTADCKNLPSVPSPDREQDQREEIILPLTVEDSLHQTISDESENVVKEMVYGVNNKQEIKTGRGQLEKEESSIPKSTAPAHAQDNGTTPIDFTDSGACAKNEESEGPLTEDDKRKCKRKEISSIPASNLAAHCSEESTETCLDKISGDKKLVKDDSVQNTEIYTNPSKSVTVQMSSRLMSTGQKVSLSEGLKIKSIMSQCFEDEPVITSELDTLKEGLRETREASIQTDTIEMKTRNRWPDPQLLPPFYRHGHLTKSVSLDTGLYGKYRSSYCEVFGAWSAQCGHSCHCFCCHHCCHCSNPAAIELQLLKMLELLQDTALRTITPCTIHEIEVMKRSCQSFREKLDEIEQHLVEQQNLFSSAMSDEGSYREEKRQLQVLRQAVRREVSELEYQLNDRSRQVREGILM
uniref:ITPR interacting domain containing 1 n=1 Tax=Pelodiscus sinensis TaxID=13735 RepID=K7G5M7_PELSI